MAQFDSFINRIQDDLAKYGERRATVRASILDILTVKTLSPEHMHVNPDDEFSNPKVGPSDEIVERYIEEARKDMEAGALSFDEPIMVAKIDDKEYMIVDGHHRWAAAVKVGLTQVRVLVVNPGWEDLEAHFA